MNLLFLGDCLDVLKNEIETESIDLVYIDPPFNSKRNYNIFLDNKDVHTQRVAFEDTWTLKNVQDSLCELHTLPTEKIYNLLMIYKDVAPHSFPYLVMMSLRILEIHRILKQTGSFYLHCDSTMSHYLKTVCDVIFGYENFKNDIVWERTFNSASSKTIAKKFPANTDIILFYAKSKDYFFNKLTRPYQENTVKRYDKIDENGKQFKWSPLKTYSQEKLKKLLETNEAKIVESSKYPLYKHYLDETKGSFISNLWHDVKPIGNQSQERLGYPTQKPKALLERIIEASCPENGTVLDAFCGCGTTLDASESLNKKWVGIDISPIAVSLIKRRLNDSFGTSLSKFEIRGVPKDKESANKLWQENPFAFQDWWITEFEVFSTTLGTKGADKGIDGKGLYLIDNLGNTLKVGFQVKGGKVQSKDVDALLGSLQKEKCDLGILLTIEKPTKPMLETVANAGFVETQNYKFPKLQILTLDEFFENKTLRLPPQNVTFKSANFKGKFSPQEKFNF